MPTPAQVVAAFQKQIASTLNLHDELILSVAQHPQKKSLENVLAEQCVLGVAVQWEAFLHDLIVSYIEQRPAECIKFHQGKITQSIRSKSHIFLTWITFAVPAVLSRAHIEEIVDPKGWNITAESAESLAELTNTLLSAATAKKFSLPDVDRKFVDLTLALRNYLSHRSAGSLTKLNDKLADFQKTDKKSPLRGKLTDVGAYLKGTPKNSPGSRAKVIGLNLSTLAAKLV